MAPRRPRATSNPPAPAEITARLPSSPRGEATEDLDLEAQQAGLGDGPAHATSTPLPRPSAATPPPMPLRALTPLRHISPAVATQGPPTPMPSRFAKPYVAPLPEAPDGGLWASARYALGFARARWQRRRAIMDLRLEITRETAHLEEALRSLGQLARGSAPIDQGFAAELAAIAHTETRKAELEQQIADLSQTRDAEAKRYDELAAERAVKLAEAEEAQREARREHLELDQARRELRDRKRELERRAKGYARAASQRQAEARLAIAPETRHQLTQAAREHTGDAEELDRELREVDKRQAALDRPWDESVARVDAANAELAAAKLAQTDAREGHGHRLAELEADGKRMTREISDCDTDIARRLATLGTLVNLHRPEVPAFGPLYDRLDILKAAITERSAEAERLDIERVSYHRDAMFRGLATIAVVVLGLVMSLVWVF